MSSHAVLQVVVQPHETLFETGDNSSSGIFIVLEGAIGVYMHDGDKLMHTNTLRPGESVGDVDILDGENCISTTTCAFHPKEFLTMVMYHAQEFLHYAVKQHFQQHEEQYLCTSSQQTCLCISSIYVMLMQYTTTLIWLLLRPPA